MEIENEEKKDEKEAEALEDGLVDLEREEYAAKLVRELGAANAFPWRKEQHRKPLQDTKVTIAKE